MSVVTMEQSVLPLYEGSIVTFPLVPRQLLLHIRFVAACEIM